MPRIKEAVVNVIVVVEGESRIGFVFHRDRQRSSLRRYCDQFFHRNMYAIFEAEM